VPGPLPDWWHGNLAQIKSTVNIFQSKHFERHAGHADNVHASRFQKFKVSIEIQSTKVVLRGVTYKINWTLTCDKKRSFFLLLIYQ
jgi:hypothetical protein